MSTATGEIFVASPRGLLLTSVHSAKGCHDVRELCLAEGILLCVRIYLRSSNLPVLGSWGAGGLARPAHLVSSLAGINHSVEHG